MTIVRFAGVLAALGLAACVKTSTSDCGNGHVCPPNTVCHAIESSELPTCVTESQLGVCGDAPDRTECTLEGVLGTCYSGACYPAECGDHVLDRTEACDEGDRIAGDGCSANCMSRELCGDGLIDPSLGEQCDDGGIGLSGDGCSSTCLREYDLWSDRSIRAPGARRDHALARAPGGGVMYVGGVPGMGTPDPADAVAEAWQWDGTSWGQLVSATPPPSARSGAAAAYDPGRDEFLLFGGRDVTGAPLDELWTWNGIEWSAVPAAATRPSARYNASMACSSSRCVLYGGTTATGLAGDTWIWNGSWVQLPGMGPSARERAALVHDAVRDRFFLFGGRDVGGTRQDTWELAAAWAKKATTLSPPPSAQPAAAFDGSLIVLATGNATWTFNGTDWSDTTRVYPQDHPALVYAPDLLPVVVSVAEARNPHEWRPSGWSAANHRTPSAGANALLAAYAPMRGRTVVVESSVTWEWDARRWRQVTAGGPRPSMDAAVIAFDTACDRVVVFDGTLAVNPTWTFDGTWTRQPFAGPPAGSGHAMTYDAKREAVVVFGGLDTTSQPLRDVWELRGPCDAKVWTRVPTTGGPSARHAARMAFDPGRGVSVLFGGNDGKERDDTWEWDGTTWTEKVVTQNPPPRSDHGMAYDPRRREVVMFGGGFGGAFLGDTWTWDGAAWTALAPIASPPGLVGMALAEDSTGGLVLLGGAADGDPTNDMLWRLGAETNVAPRERCVFGGVDEDGDGLVTCDDPDCGARCAPLCPLGTSCMGPRCGDGMCGAVEDYLLCPVDCPAP